MIKNLKYQYKYILFVLYLILLNGFLIKNLNGNISYVLIAFAINVLVIGIFAFFFHKKEKMKMEYIFLIMFIPISFAFFLLMPVSKVPDEYSHFMRSYEISEGHLITTSRRWDSSIYNSIGNGDYKTLFDHFKVKTSKEKAPYKYDNTSLYAFVCYIPQAFGIKIAKIFKLNILFQAYMGRLFNLAVFIAMMFFAIKLIPFKKECIFIISFLPIVIQEAISLSPDALTIATATLFVSSILYFKNKKDEKFTKIQFTYLAILALILSLCKIVYLPICLLLFLLPKEKFSSLKKKNVLIILLAIFVVLVNLIWLKLASQFLPSNDSIDSSKQLIHIFSCIPRYVMTIFKTYDKNILDLVLCAFGRSLGYNEIFVSNLYILPLVFVVFMMFLTNNYEKIKLKKFEKYFIEFIVLSVVLLLSTSLYLQWTPIGSDQIAGIQGRYFVPLLPLIAFFSTKIKITPKINWNSKYLYIFLVGLNYYTLMCIFFKCI